MKRLILGILVAFSLVGLANAEGYRLFSGENLEKYEQLKQEWEALKESAKNTHKFGECDESDDFYKSGCFRFNEAKMLMEILDISDKVTMSDFKYKYDEYKYQGLYGQTGAAGKILGKKYSYAKVFSDKYRTLKDAESKLQLLKADLLEIDGIRGYNEYKAKLAKCRLSGKECVEE